MLISGFLLFAVLLSLCVCFYGFCVVISGLTVQRRVKSVPTLVSAAMCHAGIGLRDFSF